MTELLKTCIARRSDVVTIVERRIQPEIKTPLEDGDRHGYLAPIYYAMARQADAERTFERLKALDGDAGALFHADVYTQWGNRDAALEWLAKAERLRDPGMVESQIDWMLDPIRNER